MINTPRPGQSLIEAMVALAIIITAISSAMALVQSSITASRIGGSQIVAANLAREGIEVVRSVRDSNWLDGNSFQVGLTDPTTKTARPILDTAVGNWSLAFGNQTIGDSAATLYMDSSGVFLNTDVPPPGAYRTLYQRLLTLDYICRNTSSGAERIETAPVAPCNGGTETLVGLAVTSSVQWTGASPRTTSIEERFYDWR